MSIATLEPSQLAKPAFKAERNACLASISNDRACEILNKTQVLFFALWKGVGISTTEQVAIFYEVPTSTVRQVSVRLRDEFVSDGLKCVQGQDLDDARDILSLASRASQLVLWTPRAVLRLGMVLKSSSIAKQVRTSLLDLAQRTEYSEPKAPQTRIQTIDITPVAQPQLPPVDKFTATLSKSQTIADTILERLGINKTIQAQYMVNAMIQACPEDQALLQPAKALLLAAAPQEAQDLTPTELAAQLGEGYGARQVNTLLAEVGLQAKINDGKRNIWQLTERGKEYGQVYLATGDSNQWSGGQIRWNPKVLGLLKTAA